MSIKVGDLVRVRDDARKLNLGNKPFEGQLGVVVEVSGGVTRYPLATRMIASGDIIGFRDEELDDATESR